MQEVHAHLQPTYASFRRRLVAYGIDWIICSAGVVAVNAVAGFAGPILGAVISFVFGLGIGIAYYGGFESSHYQATPGKMLLGLKVTDIDGNRPKFNRALARKWAMCVSWATLGIGYLMILRDEKRQGLHDKIANCLVWRVPKVMGCGDTHTG